MPIVGQPKSFDSKFLFKIFIDGFLEFGFSKMTELTCDVAEIKHYEGGTLIPNKSAGRLDFKDITLERGVTRNRDMMLWFLMVANAPANVGLTEAGYKRHLDVVQFDRSGAPVKRYSVFNAWPKTYTAGDWDNTTDEVMIEKMVLAYDYYIQTL